MCGIAGGWWQQLISAQTQLPQALHAMRHRGPNDQGVELFPFGPAVVALGQVRLSIIDLSEAGHQPMHTNDGRWVIVFNGEIYNYRELRAELRELGHSFTSDTDTEVLLAAWRQWEHACLPRLVGMFAFVVLDKHKAVLTCVRDAFGIKPFFYTADGDGFRFASELPALLQLLPTKPALNQQRAYDYLVHGDYDSSSDTFYAGVHHLPPGHWLSVDLEKGLPTVPQRWWVPTIEERSGWRFDDAVEQVREQFLHNIRLHLRSDVPLGAALSGGIDSSAVVCAMRHVAPDLPIHTFSYIAAGSEVNEEPWVDLANTHVGALSHKVIVTPQELIRDLDDMIRVQGEPFGSTSIYAQYRVFQLAKENGVSVTLDGQGADEMLAGYNGYPGQRLRSLIDKGQWGNAWSFLNAWAKWPGRSHMQGAKWLVSEMTEGSLHTVLRRLNGMHNAPSWINANVLREQGVQLEKIHAVPEFNMPGRRVMDELALSLHRRGLTWLLRHGDRNSMRFSIESRVPFLTLDMVELLLSMPEEYLISPRGETKHVFREAMRGIVPEKILNRKDKIGFSTPENNFLLALKKPFFETLDSGSDLEFINKAKIKEDFEKSIKNNTNSAIAWRWINFFTWLNK